MSFATERVVKAVRKRHRCDGCRQHIEVGQPANRWAGMSDGEFAAVIYHPECREAEVALNDILGSHGAEEWCVLSDIEDEDRPWLIEEFPIVAQRMGLAAPTTPAGEDAA